MSNPTRKMHRCGRSTRAIKKGTPYRRLIATGWGDAIHTTKGRVHDGAVLAYRAKYILSRVAGAM